MFERAGEILRSSIAADVAIDAGAVNVEGAGDVFFDFVVRVRQCRVPSKSTYQNDAEPTTQQLQLVSRPFATEEAVIGPGRLAFALRQHSDVQAQLWQSDRILDPEMFVSSLRSRPPRDPALGGTTHPPPRAHGYDNYRSEPDLDPLLRRFQLPTLSFPRTEVL